jgi:hypothetical protein
MCSMDTRVPGSGQFAAASWLNLSLREAWLAECMEDEGRIRCRFIEERSFLVKLASEWEKRNQVGFQFTGSILRHSKFPSDPKSNLLRSRVPWSELIISALENPLSINRTGST